MFDFSKEAKEKYYEKAEGVLADAGLTCFKVDRDRFATVGNEKVKIYFVPFTKNTVSNSELARAKKVENLYVVNERNKNRGGMGYPLRENAYLVFKMDEEDKDGM